MTADIVAAYVSANAVQTTQLPDDPERDWRAGEPTRSRARTPVSEPPQPPVPIRKSVTPDYIICLEDGRKLKMLKRHLHELQHVAGRLSGEMGLAGRVSDGRSELRRASIRLREEDRQVEQPLNGPNGDVPVINVARG